MSKQEFKMGDYVEVADRIVEFRTKYPEGSLQPADLAVPYRIEVIDGATYIAVVAAAYRTADDQRPGIGMAYEAFPGKTPYTKGSELQNAETSAWGRAIVAALAADTKRGIASAEEHRNRDAERTPIAVDPLVAVKKTVWAAAQRKGWSRTDLSDEYAAWSQGVALTEASVDDLTQFAETLK